MQVEQLQVSAFKGVRHVNIRPGGLVVAITGRNAAGKSSVLDALQWAIGGAKFAPDTPVRKGNAKAEVSVDLGELRITRTQTKAGSMQLVVTTRDGVPQKSPQALLDSLFAAVAFDPLGFIKAKPAEQRDMLIDAAGIRETVTRLDADATQARQDRTEVGRRVKTLEAQLAALPVTDGPTEEVSVGDLGQRIAAAHAEKAKNADARKWYATKQMEYEKASQAVTTLEAQLAQARQALVQIESAMESWKPKIDALVDPDIAALEAQLRDIEGTNRQIRDRAQRQRLAADLSRVRSEHAGAERRIEDAAIRKADALSGSPLPIRGLGLTDDGVTLDGVPIGQANWAAQIKASVALAAAVSPKLKVALVREGSALDDENQKALEEAATAAGLQVWIERVTNGEHVGITIVDGEVEGEQGGVA